MGAGVDLSKFKDPWPSIGGSTPAAGGASWIGAAGSLLGGFMGGSSAQPASGGATSYSGLGGFSVDNEFSPKYKKPLLDLTNPVHVLVAGLLVVGGVYAYKRFKK
jgi:hypothetical protein